MSSLIFKTVTAEEFNSSILTGGINAVLKITTNWSGASHIVNPFIDDLAEQFSRKIEFFAVDYDRDISVRKYYLVTTFPTLLFFRQGTLVDQLSGIFHRNILHSKLQSIIEN